MIKRNKLVVVILVIFLALLSGYAVYQNTRFRVVGTVPDVSEVVATSTGTIVVNFNKNLRKDGDYMKRLDDVSGTVRSIAVRGKQMFITLRPLAENAQYSFTLKDITSESGSTIESFAINFTAKYIPESQLSPEQRRLQMSETDQGNVSDPILNSLPYGGLHFRLNSSGETAETDSETTDNGGPKLLLNAELLFSKADMSDRNAAQLQYQKEVLDYIISLKLDPKNYVIRYTIVEPTL